MIIVDTTVPPTYTRALVHGLGITYEGIYSAQHSDLLRRVKTVVVSGGIAYLVCDHVEFTLGVAPHREQEARDRIQYHRQLMADIDAKMAALQKPTTPVESAPVQNHTERLPSIAEHLPSIAEHLSGIAVDPALAARIAFDPCTYVLSTVTEVAQVKSSSPDSRDPRIALGRITMLEHSLDGVYYTATPVDPSGRVMRPFMARYIRLYTREGLQPCKYGVIFSGPNN